MTRVKVGAGDEGAEKLDTAPGTDLGPASDTEFSYIWIANSPQGTVSKVETTTGLVSPYTYSDMTGAGLGLVVNPPAG